MMYSKAKQVGKRFKPKRAKRGEFGEKDRLKAIEEHSHKYGGCYACGSTDIELHHVKYKSQGGRGKWRNGIPLCHHHHTLAHTHKKTFNRSLEEFLISKYGEYYFMDEHDLYDRGLIESPTEMEYEEFMSKQKE